MFHGTLVVGSIYIVRLAGRDVRARFLNVHFYNPHFHGNTLRPGRQTTRYHFENLDTGRTIILKSKQRIIRLETQAIPGQAVTQ